MAKNKIIILLLAIIVLLLAGFSIYHFSTKNEESDLVSYIKQQEQEDHEAAEAAYLETCKRIERLGGAKCDTSEDNK